MVAITAVVSVAGTISRSVADRYLPDPDHAGLGACKGALFVVAHVLLLLASLLMSVALLWAVGRIVTQII